MNRTAIVSIIVALASSVSAPALAGSVGVSNTYTSTVRCGYEKNQGYSYDKQSGVRVETQKAMKLGHDGSYDISTNSSAKDVSVYQRGSHGTSSYQGVVRGSSFSHATESYSAF